MTPRTNASAVAKSPERLSYSFSLSIGAIAALLLLFHACVVSGIYYFVWSPLQRQEFLLRTSGLFYPSGLVFLVGDSIIASVTPQCPDTINLGIPGSKASALNETYAQAIASRQPSKILIMIGINDLRAGAQPTSVAASVGSFARQLRKLLPNSQILILSILPVVDNAPIAQVSNKAVERANELIAAEVSVRQVGFLDLSNLFGGTSLAEGLTYDGLHLNAQGVDRLSELLIFGVAGSRKTEGCGAT